MIETPPLSKFQYHVKTTAMDLNIDSSGIFGITDGVRISNQGDWQLSMNNSTAEELASHSEIDQVILILDNVFHEQRYIFPQSNQYKWNKDYFGPLIIPAKGDSVLIKYDKGS